MGVWGAGYIVIPSSEDDNYLSLVGQMDPRATLYVNTSQYAKEHSNQADAKVFPDENVGSRATADVCVMSAKLAYENAAVVKRVVEQIWNMNFVGFYSCWNGKPETHLSGVFCKLAKNLLHQSVGQLQE